MYTSPHRSAHTYSHLHMLTHISVWTHTFCSVPRAFCIHNHKSQARWAEPRGLAWLLHGSCSGAEEVWLMPSGHCHPAPQAPRRPSAGGGEFCPIHFPKMQTKGPGGFQSLPSFLQEVLIDQWDIFHCLLYVFKIRYVCKPFSISPFRPAMLQVLNSRVWLAASILSSAALGVCSIFIT